MEKEMTGADRRKEILSMIRDTDTPVSGTAIGKKTGCQQTGRGAGILHFSAHRGIRLFLLQEVICWMNQNRQSGYLKYAIPMNRWRMN